VPTVCGSVTSGGTESIILAMKAHRDFYKRKLWGAVTGRAEVICAVSAHAAVDKGSDLLGEQHTQVNNVI